MRFQSLKSKLLFSVFALVMLSVLTVSFFVIHQYSHSLRESMAAHSENLAHELAVTVADMILINDLVSLQRLLDMHMKSNPGISYIFVQRNGRILANTFERGIPSGLIGANHLGPEEAFRFQRIASKDGDRYTDIAFPIFSGKAGMLRMGFSEAPYRKRLTKIWLEVGTLTFVILIVAFMGGLLFITRITRPIAALAKATEKVDKGDKNVRVRVEGRDEVGKLAASFNHMITRMETYTNRLEEQTLELDRAYNQTRTFCGIVQEIGALRSLREIGFFLNKRFKEILKCGQMSLLILSDDRNIIFTMSARNYREVRDPGAFEKTFSTLNRLTEITFSEEMLFTPPVVPVDFQKGLRQAVVPLRHENQPFGALIIACPGGCTCNMEEIEGAGLILSQATGVIKRAVMQEEEISDLRGRLGTQAEFSGIVGKDPKMQLIYRLIENIAPTDATILIQGESGTGKELLAKAIHDHSLRKTQPFIVINCSAYPDTLVESELFGHEKGAFTGAIRQKPGRFELADGGTVFLDEIGDITPSAQTKLLRVLQTRKFERLGGEKTLSVNVRIIAATNKDLLDHVRKGLFREDLYYRLNVIPIRLPPLRERRNDIPLLARHFINLFTREQKKKIGDFSTVAMRLLLDYHWPGNVRELENSVEHAVLLAKNGKIEIADLPASIFRTTPADQSGRMPTLAENEKEFLEQVLGRCGWNKRMAARNLAISRNTLYLKLKKYQLSAPNVQ